MGGRVPGLTTCTGSYLDTESYSRSCPSKLELQVVLGLLSGGSLLHTGLSRLVFGPLGLGGSTFRVHGPTYEVSPHQPVWGKDPPERSPSTTRSSNKEGQGLE